MQFNWLRYKVGSLPGRCTEQTGVSKHTPHFHPSAFESSGFAVQVSKLLLTKTLKLPKMSTHDAALPDTITQTRISQE